mmetsp:Transcript_39509/g.63992  ORF Transcript_39509/g.63992 Transcript_39509/m.63992 type:complete len:200 (-) Transcript_39509:701-1300(-)
MKTTNLNVMCQETQGWESNSYRSCFTISFTAADTLSGEPIKSRQYENALHPCLRFKNTRCLSKIFNASSGLSLTINSKNDMSNSRMFFRSFSLNDVERFAKSARLKSLTRRLSCSVDDCFLNRSSFTFPLSTLLFTLRHFSFAPYSSFVSYITFSSSDPSESSRTGMTVPVSSRFRISEISSTCWLNTSNNCCVFVRLT